MLHYPPFWEKEACFDNKACPRACPISAGVPISGANKHKSRSASSNKLHQARSTNNTNNNFYFNRLPRIWNALPTIDLNEHPTRIKNKLSKYLRKHFLNNFNPAITCSFSILCPCINCSKVPQPPNFDKL